MSRSVAYFSMEIGVKPEIKTYSGGLGVLAGDTLKSAADIGEDFTAVTLMYRNGYFKQVLEDKWQHEEDQDWSYRDILEDTNTSIHVEINGRTVEANIWRYSIEGESDVDILFLDTDQDSNNSYDQDLTSGLYSGDDKKRLSQEVLLGVGGVKALEELGYENDIFHMNEGHSALLSTVTDGKKVFTTHTPVAAGHDSFPRELVEEVIPDSIVEQIDGDLNMTELGLKNSEFVNAVSDKHSNVSAGMFPGYSFEPVTNGVHSESWTSESFRKLFDKRVSDWRKDPLRLSRVDRIPDNEIWEAKNEAFRQLEEMVERKTGKKMDRELLTIGFARRFTGYKRPNLLFKDLERLEHLAKKYGGLQIVIGGKAHPDDTHGKELVKHVLSYSEMTEETDIYFIEDYGMEEALKMVSGSDVWLNNPERGKEASGTSGMKAAHNGTPQLSTLDGWWIEGHIEDVTGWSIGEDYVEGEDEDSIDSESIYRKLDHIMDIYQNDRQKWICIMRNCVKINASYFNTDRMLKEYVTRAYR